MVFRYSIGYPFDDAVPHLLARGISMRPKRLLAKSYVGAPEQEPPDYALLIQHTRDVVDAGEALLEILGEGAVSNAGLAASEWGRLRQAVRLNTWLQDLGKANDHYTAMVSGQPEIVQLLRHETVTGLIVSLPEFREWLQSKFGHDVILLALLGAVGHHRKFSDRHWEPKPAKTLIAFLGHNDFREILGEMRKRLKLGEPKPELFVDRTIGTGRGGACDLVAGNAVHRMLDEIQDWAEENDTAAFRRLVALVKALGIAADVCASAVARTATGGTSLDRFVRDNLSIGLISAHFDQLCWRWAWENVDPLVPAGGGFRLLSLYWRWAWQDVDHGHPVPREPSGFPPGFSTYPFQRHVAASESTLTLAQAGCGSGKSLAAYLWGQNWCRRWEKQRRTGFRFIFTLPTTGTTTEHFKDYALASGVAPELKALCHSRADVDLAFVANESAPQEESDPSEDSRHQAEQMIQAQRDKIESLELWGTPLVVSTADTVLGLMANARRSVLSFPALMQSAIVFDEVHAYDDTLFNHLLIFLETFPKIPVLLMTASLPQARREAIENIRPDLAVIPGPPDLEKAPRYEPPLIDLSDEEIWKRVRDCLNDPERGKVLWVRNQVDWAVQTYRRCFGELPDPKPFVGLYHSRFRYKDRVRVHREVIDSFRQKNTRAILVATQVAEMSLNLSADLLVTDLAPISALIQRLGRLNRESTPRERPSGQSIICSPPLSEATGQPDFLPYEQQELDLARSWIADLIKLGGRLNQRQLVEVFSRYVSGKSVDLSTARRNAVFVSGVWKTYPATTRGESRTISVVLEHDRSAYPEGRLGDRHYRRSWLREHEVSIPIRPEIRSWETFGHVPIAPADRVIYGKIDSDDQQERVGAAWRA